MRDIDAGIEAHYTTWPDGDQRYTAFQLIELVGSATYRFTDAPIPVIWNGFTWANVWFIPSELTIDGNGEVAGSVTFEDASTTIRTLALATDLNQYVLKLYEVWANADNTMFGQDEIIRGQIDGVSCDGEDTDEPMAVVTLTSIFASSAVGLGPRQLYEKDCPYEEFKGPECQAVTAATFCDRRYSTCLGFVNTHNFGGSRYALGEDVTISWGIFSGRTTTRVVRPVEPPPPPTGAPPPPVTPNTPGRHRSVRH